MSTLLYGTLTRQRLKTKSGMSLTMAQTTTPADEGSDDQVQLLTTDSEAATTVGRWQDALVALVPAEVLALHGVAMTLGTTTSGSGDEAMVRIVDAAEMRWVFAVLAVLAAFLYLASAGSFHWEDFLRAAVASTAFVLWTMIQPSTAFDAFAWEPSTLVRVVTAIVGAIGLSVLVALLARRADVSDPSD